MKNNMKKRIQVGLMGIVLVLMYSGCAQLNKDSTGMQASGAQEMSSEKANTQASIEGKDQQRQKSRTGRKNQQYQSSTPCVHTVRWSGETLSVIAKWYTGSFENWKGIVKANPKLKPNRLYIGRKILIPEDLVENRDPMPQEFLGKMASKRKKK